MSVQALVLLIVLAAFALGVAVGVFVLARGLGRAARGGHF